MSPNEQDANTLIADERRINQDIEKLMRYVKEDLFFRAIDVFEENQLKVDSYLYRDFMKRGKTAITGLGINDDLPNNLMTYMKYLWSKVASKKFYKYWLATRRSNAYQAVQDRFFRKSSDMHCLHSRRLIIYLIIIITTASSYLAGLCKECDESGQLLPSIEHFQRRYENPRVYFLFYHYFVRAVMGESKWKRNIESKRKLATNIAEAYAHSIIENNYFAWLFEYKTRRQRNNIKTEYDDGIIFGGEEEAEETEWKDLLYMPSEVKDIEISVPEGEDTEFKLVTKDEDEDKYEEIRQARKELVEQMGRKTKDASESHKRKFDKMNDAVLDYERDREDLDDMEAKKRRRRVTGDLKVCKKGKRGSDASKKLIFDIKRQIREDSQSGRQKQFEKTYTKVLEAIKVSNDGGEEEERYRVDCDELYASDDEE